MFVGKQEFHGGEAGLCRSVKTVEERHLGEHHGEIGGKTGHRRSSCGSFLLISARPGDAWRETRHRSAPPGRRRRGPCRRPPSSETSAARLTPPAPEISPCAPCPG